MSRKTHKYLKKSERIKEIFETPKEGEYIIISQLNSIKASKFDQLKKYGIEKKIMIEFLNLKKIKSIFAKDQEILQRLNNEIILIKGKSYGNDFKELIQFLEKEDIYNKGLLLLTILIAEDGKYRELAIETFKQKDIKVTSKEEAMINLFKIMRGKVMGIGIKLISILKKKEEEEKKC